MKSKIQAKLQYLLGYKRYLLLFSLAKCFIIKFDKKSEDFFYFLHIIPKNKGILDIGANLGFLTWHFSKVENSKVFAFEPIKENYFTLTRIVRLFNLRNVKCFNYALGDVEKKVNMFTPIIKGVKKSGLSRVLLNDANSPHVGEKYLVNQKCLDEIIELNDIEIGAIKIDVENHEYFVLKGGISLIRKNMPIIYCELWENENFDHCKKFLESLGYQIQVYTNGCIVPYIEKEWPHKTTNFFFTPSYFENDKARVYASK